ncbi:hypothetical protein GJ496_011237 [Pomphorhynchus laevis]|nr:hypothetical protein GJ496_002415 [Pomphorhynchus laevis]KAI0986350.1 hypothetical protein GJ496_011237 [Pomphorhynchus laevis]
MNDVKSLNMVQNLYEEGFLLSMCTSCVSSWIDRHITDQLLNVIFDSSKIVKYGSKSSCAKELSMIDVKSLIIVRKHLVQKSFSNISVKSLSMVQKAYVRTRSAIIHVNQLNMARNTSVLSCSLIHVKSLWLKNFLFGGGLPSKIVEYCLKTIFLENVFYYLLKIFEYSSKAS